MESHHERESESHVVIIFNSYASGYMCMYKNHRGTIMTVTATKFRQIASRASDRLVWRLPLVSPCFQLNTFENGAPITCRMRSTPRIERQDMPRGENCSPAMRRRAMRWCERPPAANVRVAHHYASLPNHQTYSSSTNQFTRIIDRRVASQRGVCLALPWIMSPNRRHSCPTNH
jgi:hypothetical protein